MRIKNKIVPTLTNLNLRNLNDIITEIFREINKVSKSAEEITFRINEKGQRELIINDKGKEYRDVTGVAVFDINNVESLKNKAKTKVKENLEIDKVTNESKATMFTDSEFTNSGSPTKPVIYNGASNVFDISANDATSADFKFRLKGGTSFSSTIIQLMEGASARWALGFDSSTDTVFRINYGNNIGTYEDTDDNGDRDTYTAADVLSLTSTGNLSINGDLTVSGGDIIGGTDTSLTLAADLNVDVHLDNDNDGTQFFRVLDGADAANFSVAETGAVTCTTVDTGQGANELYDMDQNVKTDSTVGFAEITSGAVVWQRFQFYIIGGNTSRFYYLDHDDRYNSLAHWDNYSTVLGIGTNLTMLDERMSAFPEVAENCIFAGGIGTIYNDTGTDNPKISIYYDDSTLSGDEDTTESFASLVDTDVTINTQDRKYGFTLDAVTGTTLNAGCKYVPTVSNIATTVWGSMTLKFITK